MSKKKPSNQTNVCHECHWQGEPEITFENGIPDLMQRIKPGDEVPSGECPQCHALCYDFFYGTED